VWFFPFVAFTVLAANGRFDREPAV
jgi:hypothetical protein